METKWRRNGEEMEKKMRKTNPAVSGCVVVFLKLVMVNTLENIWRRIWRRNREEFGE
jgi:hypothetical protein